MHHAAGHESNWVVNGSIRLAHLYISEAQFALGCVRLLDREPRELQLQEATFLDDPQQSLRFRQLTRLDWNMRLLGTRVPIWHSDLQYQLQHRL